MLTIELRVVTVSYMMSTKLSLTQSVYFLWDSRRVRAWPGPAMDLDNVDVCRKMNAPKRRKVGKLLLHL